MYPGHRIKSDFRWIAHNEYQLIDKLWNVSYFLIISDGNNLTNIDCLQWILIDYQWVFRSFLQKVQQHLGYRITIFIFKYLQSLAHMWLKTLVEESTKQLIIFLTDFYSDLPLFQILLIIQWYRSISWAFNIFTNSIDLLTYRFIDFWSTFFKSHFILSQ